MKDLGHCCGTGTTDRANVCDFWCAFHHAAGQLDQPITRVRVTYGPRKAAGLHTIALPAGTAPEGILDPRLFDRMRVACYPVEGEPVSFEVIG